MLPWQHRAFDGDRNTDSKEQPLVAQLVKNLPAMQETQVQPLGGEDPLEKEMVTHSSILTWKLPWTEEPGGLQSTGSQRVRHDSALNLPPRTKITCQRSAGWGF